MEAIICLLRQCRVHVDQKDYARAKALLLEPPVLLLADLVRQVLEGDQDGAMKRLASLKDSSQREIEIESIPLAQTALGREMRTRNMLEGLGIFTVGHLLAADLDRIGEAQNCGPAALRVIEQCRNAYRPGGECHPSKKPSNRPMHQK